MMSKTLGAPFGGTMRAGQYGLEPFTVGSILPPNFWGGAGICDPSMVTVPLGAPGVPVICWAVTAFNTTHKEITAASASATIGFIGTSGVEWSLIWRAMP